MVAAHRMKDRARQFHTCGFLHLAEVAERDHHMSAGGISQGKVLCAWAPLNFVAAWSWEGQLLPVWVCFYDAFLAFDGFQAQQTRQF